MLFCKRRKKMTKEDLLGLASMIVSDDSTEAKTALLVLADYLTDSDKPQEARKIRELARGPWRVRLDPKYDPAEYYDYFFLTQEQARRAAAEYCLEDMARCTDVSSPSEQRWHLSQMRLAMERGEYDEVVHLWHRGPRGVWLERGINRIDVDQVNFGID